MLLAYISGTFGFSFPLMVTFLVPLRAHELGASLWFIGLLVGAPSLIGAVTSIPSGALTERIGPRRAYLVGTIISTVVTPLFAFTSSIWVMLVLQLLFGPFRITGWVASQTYITGIGAPAERATITGRFAFATNVGTMVAPLLIGAVAQLVGFKQAFLFVALMGLAYTIVGLALPEVRMPRAGVAASKTPSAGFVEALALLRLRGMQVAMLLTFVRVWYQTGWTAFFPLYLVEQGMAPGVVGTVLSSASVAATVTALGAGRLARLASKEAVTAAALAVGVMGVVISPHAVSLPLVYLPTLLYGIGVGLSLPLLLAIISEAAPPGQRGIAFGLRTGGNQAAATTSPIALGQMLTATGIALGYLASGAVGWSVLALALWLHQRRGRQPHGASGTGSAEG
jgi:MFS family permease